MALYEEYRPYGTSAYSATLSTIEVSSEQYRYSAKAKDNETAIYYFGVRYYPCWLGRWMSSDPVGVAEGINSYEYVSSNPIRRVDPTGLADVDFGLEEVAFHKTGYWKNVTQSSGQDLVKTHLDLFEA